MPSGPSGGANRRREIERNFYMNNTTGVTTQTPFQTLARSFYLQKLANIQYGPQTPLDQLKIAWAKKKISALGGTVPSGNYWSQCIRELCAKSGLRVTNFVGDNEETFFLLGSA